jgi:ABC-type multidrug transport system ATPase subunit
MRRKLSLAAAFAGEPPLMLLDEPTNGLDPPAVALFKDIVVELRRRGRGVLISSHLLALLEPLCDRLAILEAGEFRACGSLAAIRQQHHLDATADLEQVYLVLTGRTRSAAAALFSTVETPANAR